eukprot:PhM_4_TR7821/c0_g1_i1/m.73850
MPPKSAVAARYLQPRSVVEATPITHTPTRHRVPGAYTNVPSRYRSPPSSRSGSTARVRSPSASSTGIHPRAWGSDISRDARKPFFSAQEERVEASRQGRSGRVVPKNFTPSCAKATFAYQIQQQERQQREAMAVYDQQQDALRHLRLDEEEPAVTFQPLGDEWVRFSVPSRTGQSRPTQNQTNVNGNNNSSQSAPQRQQQPYSRQNSASAVHASPPPTLARSRTPPVGRYRPQSFEPMSRSSIARVPTQSSQKKDSMRRAPAGHVSFDSKTQFGETDAVVEVSDEGDGSPLLEDDNYAAGGVDRTWELN